MPQRTIKPSPSILEVRAHPPISDLARAHSPFTLASENPSGLWTAPAVISENNFVYKSLSNWSFNPAVGCAHACRFCYVPDASTIKLGPKLAAFGVKDPDAEWGEYVIFRPWEERAFLASLLKAERTPLKSLKRDGNRAIILSSTTDPYQTVRDPDPQRRAELAKHARFVVRRALELIRDFSTLNVRILTRSPLARLDFDLFQSFGPRLTFGMSLPTLCDAHSRTYEPHAPAPAQRLSTLHAAKKAGLHVFVAVAPTYPECDEADLRATLTAVAALEPITIFHEPINIRAENVRRIAAQAELRGVRLNTGVFATKESWQDYAVGALQTVQQIARELGIEERLHLWPDQSLGSKKLMKRMANPQAYANWLERWWTRISEWPA